MKAFFIVIAVLVSLVFFIRIADHFHKGFQKKALNFIKRFFEWLIIFICWALFMSLFFAPFVFPFLFAIYPFVFLFIVLIIFLNHSRFIQFVHQSVIIFGGKGKGKGLLYQYAINFEEQVLSNIPYGANCEVVNPSTYFESISPNTFQNAISGEITRTKKNSHWEKIPYYLDDTAVYFPNTEDGFLKKIFKSMNLFIVIQRHLYDTYTVLNAQNLDRVYKNLRELQVDGYIKARSTLGKSFIWRHLPILRKYFLINWRFYESINSALEGKLPFEKMGLINTASAPLLTTTPTALKEMYDGENGLIKDGFVFLSRKKIFYDTRYYSTLFFEDESEELPVPPEPQKV